MYRKEILIYLFSILFIASAALLHIFYERQALPFTVITLVFFLYALVILLWARNMENRVLKASVAKRFKVIALLLIGYLGTRTLKYEVLIHAPAALPRIRYIYYFFILTVVHMVFLTSLNVGRSERDSIDERWHLLWAPTGLLILMIITNDFHGLAFVPGGQATGFRQYGPVYLLTNAYILFLAALTLVITSKQSLAEKPLKSISLPLLVLGICFLYTLLYIIDWPPFRHIKIAFQSAEFNILTVVLFIESLVFARLIPSNRGYESFLNMSSLNMGMMDLKGHMVLQPTRGPKVDANEVRRASERALAINENTLLESSPIQGGTCFWFADLTDFNRLKSQLVAANEEMLSENELLMANNKLKEKMAKVREQKEIRETIHEKLQPQFARLKAIMDHLPDEKDAYEDALKDACILNVYIKRFSNLYLLSRNKATLPLSELRLSFDESLDYLRLKSKITSLRWDAAGAADTALGIGLYAAFEKILESYLASLSAVFVHLKEGEDAYELAIYVESAAEISLLEEIHRLLPQGVGLSEESEDGMKAWAISFEKEVGA